MESVSAEVIEWFDQFYAAFQCMRSLEEEDARYYQAFEDLVVRHRVWCGQDGAVNIRNHAKSLDVNGVIVSVPQAVESIQWFHDRCRKRALEELLFLSMLTPQDFQAFMTLILQDRSLFHDPDFPASFLLAHNVSLIQVNPPNVEDSFFSAVPFQIDTLDLSKLNTEERPDPLQASELQEALASRDSAHLRELTESWVQEEKIQAIHQHIGHLRLGMENRYREIQIRGYVGLRVMLLELINMRQTSVLYAVFKALPKTVSAEASADLLAFHMETFSHVMAYFHQQNKIRPLVFGFEWLANWRFHAKNPLAQLATDLLDQHFEPDVIARIVMLKNQDPVLTDHWNKLLGKYPRALSKPLLFYLYDAEEKDFRQLLLRVLKDIVPKIQGDIVREVHRAMERKAPWYIKRNLLTLLADAPPAALSPLLVRMLSEETQPQLREVIFACGFKLKTPKLYRVCEEALNQAKDEDELVVLIQHIKAGRQSHYVPHLKKLANKRSSDTVIEAAFNAMAAIGGAEAAAFLDRVLSTRRLFSGRTAQRMRQAAAQSLRENPAPEIRMLAEKFSADRDEAVRNASLEVLNRAN